jgi:hypothetical protein
MPADNKAWCMTPMLLAANATSCMQHAKNIFFVKPEKLQQVLMHLLSLDQVRILEFL